ncbi:unnamed protein product [[Candida] boidinii]|uniref:Unnamed protein product n=1 Tax=Candida boidinii TaxID=5477 RepID=A0ACB5U043_CANBO|nr:unnamed protein product [[Candida] boidinii]
METRLRLLTITNKFENKLHKEIKLIEFQEIREIEIYELQILDPDTRNWKLVCYTNEIFSPNSHIRLNNLPIDGSLSLNNIKSPIGWKYIDNESLKQKEKLKIIKKDKKLKKKKIFRKLIKKTNVNLEYINNDGNDSTYNDSHETKNDHGNDNDNHNNDNDNEENDGNEDESYDDDDDDDDDEYSYDDEEDDEESYDDDDNDDDDDLNDDEVDDEIAEFEVPRIDESAIEDDSMYNTTSQSIHTVTQSNDDNKKNHDHSFLGNPSFYSSANNTFNSETSSIHSVHSIHNTIKPFSNLINTSNNNGQGGNNILSSAMNTSNNQSNNTIIDQTLSSSTSTSKNMYKLNPKNNNKNKNNNNNSNNIITGKPRTCSSNSLLSANTITPIHYPKTNDGWALDLTPGEWVTRNCLNDLLEIDEDEKWCYDSIVAYDVQSGSIGLANNKGKRQRGDFRRRRWIRTCVRSYQPNVDPTATATTPHTSTHTIKIPASSSYHNIAKLLNHQTFNNSTTTTNNTTAATTSASTVSATNTTATVPAPQTV